MDRPDYIHLYSMPETYQPPEDKFLQTDTQYPNLNSTDYRIRCPKRSSQHNRFFECLAVNKGGLAIISTNDIRGRLWDGSIWGYENLENVTTSSAVFKLHCESPVTRLKFLEETIFLASQASGSLNVWSTRSEARDANNYCLFMVGGKTEHLGLILDLDILAEKMKAVTASSDCCIKIWDAGAADLQSIKTYRYAHSDSITGIASGTTSVFASCSRDRSALIWDYKLSKPAQALYNKHDVPFSTITWCKDQEHVILVGDESGCIYQIDSRVPDKFLTQGKIFNRPIRKIAMQGANTAVIGNTNAVHVYRNLQETPVYLNEESENFVRDIYWDSDKYFYTIGWDKQIRHHSLK